VVDGLYKPRNLNFHGLLLLSFTIYIKFKFMSEALYSTFLLLV